MSGPIENRPQLTKLPHLEIFDESEQMLEIHQRSLAPRVELSSEGIALKVLVERITKAPARGQQKVCSGSDPDAWFGGRESGRRHFCLAETGTAVALQKHHIQTRGKKRPHPAVALAEVQHTVDTRVVLRTGTA